MSETGKQAGAELGQAQLKLGLDFTPTNLHQIRIKLMQISWSKVLSYLLSRPTFPVTKVLGSDYMTVQFSSPSPHRVER